MATRFSRRQILGIGAASLAGGVTWSKEGHPTSHTSAARYQPAAAQPKSQGGRPYWQKTYSGGPINVAPLPPGLPGEHYKPVVVPNGAALPFKVVGGVKVFHLIAEEVEHAFDSGLRAKCWGYNGRVNSTVIEAVEGERIRIYVTNRLPIPTSVHWHGIYLPNGMDGVAGLTQPYIKAGETAKYEWTLRQHGSFMFHSHHDEMTQMGMGLIGMFVVHPRNPSPDYRVDRDFSLMVSEWSVKAGTARPKTLDRVTATDGEDIPLSAQWSETTALVAVGQTRNVELITDAPGDWAFHCHMTHHVMNQMGHEFPNMVGMNPEGLEKTIRPLLPAYMTMGQTGMDMGKMAEVMPYPRNTISMKGATGPFGDYISMGGLFTIVKVRDRLKSYDEDPGWYQHAPGTVALKASDAELARDGINVNEPSASGGQSAPGSATKGPVDVKPTPRPMDPHKRH
ncbi:MAG: copper oxidase [Candidatus Rokuibacteriota bacterium]|nr:MAG: copper oxidase [Candidatus Rokubacteria bacterium]